MLDRGAKWRNLENYIGSSENPEVSDWKDVAKAGISTSQLSRFERGQTDLTISKFMLILDEINVPIDEFMYAVHDFHRDDLNELLTKVRLLYRLMISMKWRNSLLLRWGWKTKGKSFITSIPFY